MVATIFWLIKYFHRSQLVGFEPTLPEGNSFRVSRLNHSATTAYGRKHKITVSMDIFVTERQQASLVQW